MNCKDANLMMHDYLDGDLAELRLTELRQHLLEYPICRNELDSLKQMEALVHVMFLPNESISEGFTERVMSAIPHAGRGALFRRWIKLHPAISIAVLFLMVMMGSFFSLWNKDTELVVKGNIDGVIIQEGLVIVPEGHIIKGNLVVENGKVEVLGTIQGNLVVVDGSIYQASTANIAGHVTSVNQTIDYFWYKAKDFISGFSW